MALDEHFVPSALQSQADIPTHIGLGHEHIQNVDAALQGGIHHLMNGFGVQALQMFTTKADLTGLQPGAAQGFIDHMRPPLFMDLSLL